MRGCGLLCTFFSVIDKSLCDEINSGAVIILLTKICRLRIERQLHMLGKEKCEGSPIEKVVSQVIKFVCPYLTKSLKAKVLFSEWTVHGYLCQALPCHVRCHWTKVAVAMEVIMPSSSASRQAKVDTPVMKLETR